MSSSFSCDSADFLGANPMPAFQRSFPKRKAEAKHDRASIDVHKRPGGFIWEGVPFWRGNNDVGLLDSGWCCCFLVVLAPKCFRHKRLARATWRVKIIFQLPRSDL